MTFDPNAAASAGSGVFGLPYSFEEAALVFLPVPWEATTSYGGGTVDGPDAILAASRQVDLFHHRVDNPWAAGMHMLPNPEQVRHWNDEARPLAEDVIDVGGAVGDSCELAEAQERVNALSQKLNDWVHAEASRIFAAGKIPGLVGGDHSTPYGLIKAATEHAGMIDVLHIDAHLDLRKAFEGFEFSHASIMRNVLDRNPLVRRLVSVGIRDFCEEEFDCAEQSAGRVKVFYDLDMASQRAEGAAWASIVDRIVDDLGPVVYISFDIDGLDPRLCPHTGTPVPGGLDFNEALYLIERVVRAGKRVVAFDLNEVSPDPTGATEWDANVGARMLYNLGAWALASQGKCKLRG